MSALQGTRRDHRLVTLDCTDWTAVAECACGRTFLGTGQDRKHHAHFQHSRHVHNMQETGWQERKGTYLAPPPRWEDWAGRRVSITPEPKETEQ